MNGGSFFSMYAQTLTVVQPRFKRPHLWIRKINKVCDGEPTGLPMVMAMASYKMVQKRIVLLHDSLKLDLPEDVVDVIQYVFSEFEAYTHWMCVTMKEPEKQAKFTHHMLEQIDKALSVVGATMMNKKKDENCVDGCTKAVCA